MTVDEKIERAKREVRMLVRQMARDAWTESVLPLKKERRLPLFERLALDFGLDPRTVRVQGSRFTAGDF